ncbi:hypothetical protein T492DRAFT_839587 [Pavlovales sp. CCMP2436]|nr:hypothetical protein T492DRAFT_839587 [Pavlovales sp. CCMP2436]
MCRLPSRVKRCSNCGMTAFHNQGQTRCYICHTWCGIKHRDKACGGRINTFTELEYLCMMHEADVRPDTGHVFDDCSPKRLMRKSPDRIDNNKGYEPASRALYARRDLAC